MKLIFDDGNEIELESIKTKEVYSNSTVIISVERLSEIKKDNLEIMRNNLKMIFFPARILFFDKKTDIEIVENVKPEDEKKIIN